MGRVGEGMGGLGVLTQNACQVQAQGQGQGQGQAWAQCAANYVCTLRTSHSLVTQGAQDADIVVGTGGGHHNAVVLIDDLRKLTWVRT